MPSAAEEQARKANDALRKVYERVLPQWKDFWRAQRGQGRLASVPLFTQVSPAWFETEERLVIVGQETHGWGKQFQGREETLTEAEVTEFGSQMGQQMLYDPRRPRRSPYWQAVRHVIGKLGLGDASQYLFSNVFPCDVDKKQPPRDGGETHDLMRKWKVLPQQLEILAPRRVLFFCGQNYGYSLNEFFGMWPKRFAALSSCVPYQPSGVSWRGAVTRHPKYLRLHRQWAALDQAIDLLESSRLGPS